MEEGNLSFNAVKIRGIITNATYPILYSQKVKEMEIIDG